MRTRPTIAVLGLGEAGGEIARDLVAAGAGVRAYGPAVITAPEGVRWLPSEAEAVSGSDLVLSVNSALDAEAALHAGSPGVGPGCVWADLNTSASRLKRTLAEIADRAGIAFVDVALMSPVPGRGLRTPMLVSGPAADEYAALLRPLGAQVACLPGPAGEAAARKLLRSVFFKGMAAAVTEAVAAARVHGCEDWLRANIAEELERAGPEMVDRLITGSIRHALRRGHEMSAAAELLRELGVPPRVCEASRDWLADLLQTADPDTSRGRVS